MFIPSSIEPEQAASLIGTGTIAFNALEKVEPNSNIAVVGTGHLAYLVTQFAKKVYKYHTTLVDYEGSEEVAKEFGADAFLKLSGETITKNTEKFNALIITDVLKEEESKHIQDMAWRSGLVIFAIDMGFCPNVTAIDIVVCKY